MSFFGGDIFSEGKKSGGFFLAVNKKEPYTTHSPQSWFNPLLKQETPLSPGLKMKPRTPTLISPSVFLLRVQKRSRWKCQKCGVCYLPYKVIQGALCPYCDKMHVYPAKNQRWQFKVHIYFLAHARRRMKFPLKVLSSNRWYVFFFSLPQREIFEQKSFFQDPGSKTAKYYAVCFVKASQQWYSFIELSSRELTYPPKMAFWRWFSFFWGGIC